MASERPDVTVVSAGGNLIAYKGYIGKVEIDNDAGIFHGEVINVRDVITFQGESVEELRQALVDSVEDYLEFCEERGEKPDKPFSGRFVVRIDPELHRKIHIRAKQEDKSLNTVISETLEKVFA
jgi:predicted HicB family RNase H-like nuclease